MSELTPDDWARLGAIYDRVKLELAVGDVTLVVQQTGEIKFCWFFKELGRERRINYYLSSSQLHSTRLTPVDLGRAIHQKLRQHLS